MDEQVIEDIYTHLADGESKRVFEKRLMYSLTDDHRFIQELVDGLPEAKWLRAKIESCEENFIFGAGNRGRDVYRLAPHRWAGILDNDEKKWGIKSGGVTIVPPKELCAHPAAQVFLSVRRHGTSYQQEIVEQLRGMGIAPQQIVRVDRDIVDRFEQYQYFDLPVLHPAKDEVFVDAGAFDGQTSECFASWAGEYGHIYAFEPSPSNQQKIRTAFADVPSGKFTLFPYGVWNEKTELHFTDKGTASGSFQEDGELSLPVISIDEALGGRRATFIKMDVEGCECAALEGARQTIQTYHPKLAICVYHKKSDILEVPQTILALSPDYRFYLRHYSLSRFETVLYAV